MHTNARTGTPSPKSIQFIVMIWSTMPGSSRPVLAPFHLQREFGAIEFVDDLFEDADEHDGLPACVLKLMKPEKHFARVKPVRAAGILSAARSERLRLLFRVAEKKGG